jgi:hypothetical protein
MVVGLVQLLPRDDGYFSDVEGLKGVMIKKKLHGPSFSPVTRLY